MAKYKAAKPKKTEASPQMRAGVPCLVLLIGAIVLAVVVMVLAITHAS